MLSICECERVVEIPWESVTLEEAAYLMENHDGEYWIDGDRRIMVMAE